MIIIINIMDIHLYYINKKFHSEKFYGSFILENFGPVWVMNSKIEIYNAERLKSNFLII